MKKMILYNSENSLTLDNSINNELWGTILQSSIDISKEELNYFTEVSNIELVKIDAVINTDSGQKEATANLIQEQSISPLYETENNITMAILNSQSNIVLQGSPIIYVRQGATGRNVGQMLILTYKWL